MSKKRKQKPKPNYRDFNRNGMGCSVMSDEERLRKEELEEYRKNRKKAWYL